MDPYVLLNISDEADDAAVKAAWLGNTHTYPPEIYPEIFEAVRGAYEAIATQRQRLYYHLFEATRVEPLTLVYLSLVDGLSPAFPTQAVQQILKDSISSLAKKNLDIL